MDIVINLSNKNVVDNPMILNNYYYMSVNDKNVILRNMRVRYVKDTIYSVIPNHTYRFLKSKGSFKDKLFVLDVTYECIIPSYTEMLKKSTGSEINLTNFGLSGHVDKDGNYIETKEKKFYFKLVSEDEYGAYKELANEKIDLKIKK